MELAAIQRQIFPHICRHGKWLAERAAGVLAAIAADF